MILTNKNKGSVQGSYSQTAIEWASFLFLMLWFVVAIFLFAVRVAFLMHRVELKMTFFSR